MHSPTLFSVLIAGSVASTQACDLCALSTIDKLKDGPGWSVGLETRISQLDRLQEAGEKIANPEHQRLTSTTLQASVAYHVNARWSVQATIPYLDRSFRRVEDGVVESGRESGIGDAVVSTTATLVRCGDVLRTFRVLGTLGVKLPTGDSGRLKEEENEVPPQPGDPESGVHGHDLALGSGSWDGLIGVGMRGSLQRWFATADLQYSLRSEGAHHFRYANDLLWSAGPGYRFLLRHEGSASLQALISGETKGEDTHEGERADDTSLTAWYLGAVVAATVSDHLAGAIGFDVPLAIDNTGTQSVTSWRLRFELAHHW